MTSGRLAAVLAAVSVCISTVASASPSLRGRIVDPDGQPLPGVTITLRNGSGDTLSATSGVDGSYTIDAVPPGRYDLEASLDLFEPAVRHDLDLVAETVTIDLQLALALVHQEVTVSAPALVNLVGSTEPAAPVAVTRDVIDIAMLPNSQVDDVLSLMPNVVRGPDGLIAVAGARATSSGLFVNGHDTSDPASGGPGVLLPLEAVDTMQVYTGGAPAEFGDASGGITAVQTRSGGDRFHMSVDSFFPRLLYGENGISGVAFWDPNLGFSGPVVQSRVWFEQAVSYRYDRNTFTTLAGPDHNLFHELLSWTQLDGQTTANSRMHAWFDADPRTTDRAGITAFTPAVAAPRVEQGGMSGGASDRLTAGHLLVEVGGSLLRTRALVTPHGRDPAVATHELIAGSYFDTQDRRASRAAVDVRVDWSPASHHTVTAGGSLNRALAERSVAAADIALLRSDGALARVVSFLSQPPARVSSTAAGLFAQDRWSPLDRLTIVAGIRADTTTAATTPVLAPRLGWAIGTGNDRTTLSGSVGLYGDTIPLDALAFSSLPTRSIASVVPSGGAADPLLVTTMITNTVAPELRVPTALRWDVQVNRRLGDWLMRVHYEERRLSDELVIDAPAPGADPGNSGVTASALASHGRSTSRSLEATAGLRTPAGTEWYVSYVRAATRGSQNTLETIEGVMRAPFLQANLSGPLPFDVPHRVLAWGVFHLPSQVTIAPFLDARSGFPYTAIDDTWLMVGTPNQHRLPWTASLDLSATKIVTLPRHLPRARVGMKLYNIVSVHTEREVQRDLDRLDFGATYDPVPRDFTIVFEFLWGHHGTGTTAGNPTP